MSEHLMFKEIILKCMKKYKEFEWAIEFCNLEGEDANNLNWLKKELEPLFKDISDNHKPDSSYNVKSMIKILGLTEKKTNQFFIKYLKLVKEYPELIPIYMFHWVRQNPDYLEGAEFNTLDELEIFWKNRWKGNNSLKDLSYQDLEELYSPYIFGGKDRGIGDEDD